ncbi:hypothetical protein AAG570_013337 [Ranatra chinensis]|uniref:RNA-directed DNA polymerase n=1 Tax=Ranatra chinensis TaxID=642074 RepID=A0ABD0YIG8_9HEMI
MEVNAVRGPRRGPRQENFSYASAASTGSYSSAYEYSSDGAWPLLPQRTQRQGRKVDRRMSGATSASPPDPGAKGQPKGWGCKMLVDTGSTSTLIKKGVIRTQGWGSRVVPCECVPTTVSGPTPLRGEIVLPLSGLSGKNRTVVAYVMDWSSNEYEAILGTDALKSVKGQIIMNSSEWRVRLGKFRYRPEGRVTLKSYVGAAVVNERGLITRANVHEHFGEVFHQEALTEVLEKEVRDLLAQRMIRKSVSPYCSPLWVVPKTPDAQGNPRYRVVVDFKELNKYTRPEKHPLPGLEEMLDRMNGATVFSLLDLKAGYHQIRMHEANCKKTAFQFGRGKYEFTRMPFGLRNVPTTFQRLMDEFLEGLNEDAIQVYMDDIIIFSRSEQEHGRHLRQLLHRLKEFGLKASWEKFTHAIKLLQEPVDVKGVRSIMGLIGYYRRFLPSLADRMEGWNSLTKKGSKFVNREDMRQALEWAKARLCENPVLRFPNFSLPFVITTDASQVAVGAVLSQVYSGGDRPVAYASKKLTPAESRYSAIERELLGVVWAVEHIRSYVWGRQFRIKTDQKPLVWVEGLRETSARITRWKERLAPYAFQITHTKGRDNLVADCLSRMVNAIDSPPPTLDVHERVEWDPGNFDLSLLGPPGGESPEPPGLGLLRRRVEEGPDLPVVPEAAARLSPVSRPESGRGSAEQRRLLWEVGRLNDKARQLSVEIVPRSDVRTSCHRYGRTRTWTVTVWERATNRDVQTAMDAILGTDAFRCGKGHAKTQFYCDYPQSLKLKIASKRRNMFNENKKRETTEIAIRDA